MLEVRTRSILKSPPFDFQWKEEEEEEEKEEEKEEKGGEGGKKKGGEGEEERIRGRERTGGRKGGVPVFYKVD